MKATILFAVLLLASLGRAFADGQIFLINHSVATSSGSVYHVPVWVDLNGNGSFDSDEGIGTYAAALGQTATLGLYVQGGSIPLATVLFRSDIYGAFLATVKDVTI